MEATGNIQETVNSIGGQVKRTMLTINNGPGHVILVSVDIGFGAESVEKQLEEYMPALNRPENDGWKQKLYAPKFF